MQVWYINYLSHFGSVKIDNIVYIGRYLVLTYTETFYSTVSCFFSYICWSVNYKSWISKFHNVFLTCSETGTRFIFEGFKYCPLWKVNFQLWNTFLTFSIWSVNCAWDFFSHFVSQQIVWVVTLNYVTYLGDVQKLKH